MACEISCDELSENCSMEINHYLMTSILLRISDSASWTLFTAQAIKHDMKSFTK